MKYVKLFEHFINEGVDEDIQKIHDILNDAANVKKLAKEANTDEITAQEALEFFDGNIDSFVDFAGRGWKKYVKNWFVEEFDELFAEYCGEESPSSKELSLLGKTLMKYIGIK